MSRLNKTHKKELHQPVLLQAVLDESASLEKLNGYFIDGTFGRGGHTRALLTAYNSLKVIGLDCDHEAIEYAEKQFSDFKEKQRFEIHRKNFSEFAGALGQRPLIGILLDLGVSSPQLDQGLRGFSFYNDGPLDMRMDHQVVETAADIVNTASEDDLINIFKTYGEIKNPTKVVTKIVEVREEKKFTTTLELADLIARTDGWKQKGYHPATNYFMALRIHVNNELGHLKDVLPQMIEKLIQGGRILVITFHSLEDRIVKDIFRDCEERGLGLKVHKNVIQADWQEKKQNPRSRSAKLRVFEKGASKELSEKKKRRLSEGYIKDKHPGETK